ncbi:MAG: bifunctional diguanylate cyclase/phosphodiesterase [Eubacteriales bacterium]
MELYNYLQMISNDCSNLVYFSDLASDELIFINQAMERRFQIFEDYRGKKNQEILSNYLDYCGNDTKERAMRGEDVVENVKCLSNDTILRSHTSVVELHGTRLLMGKLFLTAQDNLQGDSDISFEDSLKKCLTALAIPDKENSIQSLLKLLGEFYASEVAFVYELDKKDLNLSQTFAWCAKDTKASLPTINDTSKMNEFLEWIQSNEGIINIDNMSELEQAGSEEVRMFTKHNIQNITLNKLWNEDGTLLGIMGVSNRKKPFFDDRLLKTISLFIVERFHELSTSRTLKKLSETDLLTGFYNRSKYSEKLTEIHENRPKSLGVVFVNLNGLRKTNEYLGFEMGDLQIKQTAIVLREYFPGVFYRISGDEFVGFLEDCDKANFEEKVNNLQVKLKAEHHESTFSLGHSWATGSYTVSELIKVADTVMVINKQAFYSSTFREDKEVSNAILQDLFQAIAEDEFLVYLQPQINLETQEVVGAEALIRRFDKKKQKMIFPDHFIPFYEKNSIIRHVDLFVIRKSCLILLEWLHLDRAIPISVNLSRVTLMEHGIVDTISGILDEYKIPHELIIIEVTERIGLVENEVASSLVEEFKDKGFKLSLDDFGCAYSNIVTLATLTVDEIKIDKSLVDHITTNPKNATIVQYMLAMCNDLDDTHTLAEGIETEEQADFLRAAHCHLGQGYLYSRPIPNDEFFLKYIKLEKE